MLSADCVIMFAIAFFAVAIDMPRWNWASLMPDFFPRLSPM